MRIILFSRYHLSSYIGGNEVYLDTIARSLIDNGHEVTYISLTGSKVPDKYPYRVVTLSVRHAWSLVVQLWNILHEYQPNLLHTSGSSWEHTLFAFLSRIRGVRAIHSFLGATHPKQFIIRAIANIEIWLIRWLYHGVLTINERDLGLFTHSSYLKKVANIPPMISSKRLSKLTSSQRIHAHTNASNTATTLLFVAALDAHHYYKGLPILLDSMKLLPQSFTLEVVGDGPLRIKYEAQYRELIETKRVRFLGSVSDEALDALYLSRDILVLSSTSTSEGFGIVVAEALAAGMGVVVSSYAGIAQLLESAGIGTLVDASSSIDLQTGIETQARHTTSKAILARRRAFAKQFSSNSLSNTLMTFYNAVSTS